jgi:hypothetical protein
MGRRGHLRGPGAVLITILVAACSPPTPPTVAPASSTDVAPSPGPSTSPDSPPLASSQALIAADLASGTIDVPTSLELRAWALFGDARLPERYDGSGSTGEDQELFDDIAGNLESLPVDKQAELTRFLLRPTDPQSPFSTPGATASRPMALAGAGNTIAQTEQGGGCPQDFFWFHRDWAPAGGSANDGFRVWACALNEQQTSAAFDKVVGIGSDLWPKMTVPVPDGMGRPVVDAYTAGDGSPRGDGSGKVDIYLVDSIAPCRQRGENCEALEGDDVAVAPKDWPLHCDVAGSPPSGCSAYMVLGRGRTEDRDFAGVFAHEFFHVLQHAHNGRIPTSWYHEASATWAGWHFAQESYKAKAYGRFEDFQADNRSLLLYDRNALYQYQAWGWPLFQFVEAGSSNVYRAWETIENVATIPEVDHAIDNELSFEQYFREFAVRNAQPEAYLPGASTGLDDLLWQSHPALTDFPPDPHKVSGPRKTITMGTSQYPVAADPLTAQYDEFEVTDPNIKQIIVDLLGVRGADWADLDALAEVGEGGSWKRFKGADGRLVLCRDEAEENLTGAVEIVISNHIVGRDQRDVNLPDPNLAVTGNYAIHAAEETSECNASFVLLHGQLIGDRDDGLETTHATFEFYIKWNRPADPSDTLDMVFDSGEFSFETTVHGVCGGSRTAGGHLAKLDDQQRFSEGDGVDHHVGAVLSDQRLDYGRILISFGASYQVPNSDPLCQPPPSGSIDTCSLIWTPIDAETLPVDASCDDGMGTTWTGRLVQE